MADDMFHLTRTSKTPAELRVSITSTGQGFTLAPGETTVVGPEVAALLEADASLRAHFTIAPVKASAPATRSVYVEKTATEE